MSTAHAPARDRDTQPLSLQQGVQVAAAEAASLAQERAGVRVRVLDQVTELQLASELFAAIWGRSGDAVPPVTPDLLRALSYAGNYVAAAFDPAGEMQGALVGFIGGPRGDAHLHSHILGVAPSSQVRGAGFALKLHQRAWALQNGYDEVGWTFDPLVRRNAYFNLSKLGAELDSYLVNFYGAMDDAQNQLGESDRILVRWNLLSERAASAAGGTDSDPLSQRPPTSVRILAMGGSKQPEMSALNGATSALVETPEDIVRMRSEAPHLATAWRLALREKLQEVLAAGYRCAGVSRQGEYVFQRELDRPRNRNEGGT